LLTLHTPPVISRIVASMSSGQVRVPGGVYFVVDERKRLRVRLSPDSFSQQTGIGHWSTDMGSR
jgi:hypothetical protein